MSKKLPIGLSDFKRLIEENYLYIDKSLFIKDLIDSGSQVLLFPRPRRFGKTLNISMVRYFFERSAESNAHLFDNLAISTAGEDYRARQGHYPVIFLTFKDVKYGSWNDCREALHYMIAQEFNRHGLCDTSPGLTEQDIRNYRDIANARASSIQYQNSIKDLSRYLHTVYGTRAIILIDEYDNPIQQGYTNGYYDNVIAFMRVLLSAAFKDNEHLEKGVLTGILRVARESIFSGLNNLDACTVLSNEFSDKFGLTQQEVRHVLTSFDCESHTPEVSQWYNGYRFGETTIYNPWSILNYVKDPAHGARPFWINTSDNALIQQTLALSDHDVKKDLEILLAAKTIRKEINENIVYADSAATRESLWSFLLFSGYITATKQTLLNGRLICDLSIPNREVFTFYESTITTWFEQTIGTTDIHHMLLNLVSGNIDSFREMFEEFVSSSLSYFDISGDEPEKFYHAFTLGLLVQLRSTHQVQSNKESGLGRYDVVLFPKQADKPGIIIEFKKARKRRGESLADAARAALEQIEECNYSQDLQDKGVKSIIELGIAFEGKKVLVVEQRR